jgi:hypothetical protein
MGTRPIRTHESLEISSTTRAAPHPCARLVSVSSGGREKTSSFVEAKRNPFQKWNDGGDVPLFLSVKLLGDRQLLRWS